MVFALEDKGIVSKGTASPHLTDFICCLRSPGMALVLHSRTRSSAELPGPPRVSDPLVTVGDKQRGWTTQPLQVPAGILSCSPANDTLTSLCCVLSCPWTIPGAVPTLQVWRNIHSFQLTAIWSVWYTAGRSWKVSTLK